MDIIPGFDIAEYVSFFTTISIPFVLIGFAFAIFRIVKNVFKSVV